MAVEPRGACFKCGGDVTTLHLRVKDAQGRYGHVNCGPVSPTAATNECFIYTAKRKRAGGEEDSSVYVSGALDDAIVVQDSDHDSDRESGRRDAASGSASSSHFPARQREAGAGKERGRMMIANKNARIGIYDKPPCGEVPLQQFEEYALDRLRVLKGIDSAKVTPTSTLVLRRYRSGCLPIENHCTSSCPSLTSIPYRPEASTRVESQQPSMFCVRTTCPCVRCTWKRICARIASRITFCVWPSPGLHTRDDGSFGKKSVFSSTVSLPWIRATVHSQCAGCRQPWHLSRWCPYVKTTLISFASHSCRCLGAQT